MVFSGYKQDSSNPYSFFTCRVPDRSNILFLWIFFCTWTGWSAFIIFHSSSRKREYYSYSNCSGISISGSMYINCTDRHRLLSFYDMEFWVDLQNSLSWLNNSASHQERWTIPLRTPVGWTSLLRRTHFIRFFSTSRNRIGFRIDNRKNAGYETLGNSWIDHNRFYNVQFFNWLFSLCAKWISWH